MNFQIILIIWCGKADIIATPTIALLCSVEDMDKKFKIDKK